MFMQLISNIILYVAVLPGQNLMQIYVTNATKMNTNAPKNVRYDCKKKKSPCM